MAVTYGFFNSVNGDRKYNAEQMSEYFRGIINEGVYQHLDGGLAVTAGTGLAVNVAAGRAIIQNRWIQNSAAMSLTIAAASETYARKDAVVIRLNWSSRAISIAVKTGTPAASPVAPSMTRNATTYEMALAYVNVAANATSVTVTDKRSDSTVCGWVTVAQSTSGEVDAMLNAMKTGFDGVTYASPAAMVQGCDEKLQSEYRHFLDIQEPSLTYTVGKYISSVYGTVSSFGGYQYSSPFSLKAGEIIKIHSHGDTGIARLAKVVTVDSRYSMVLGYTDTTTNTVYYQCESSGQYAVCMKTDVTPEIAIMHFWDIFDDLPLIPRKIDDHTSPELTEDYYISYVNGVAYSLGGAKYGIYDVIPGQSIVYNQVRSNPDVRGLAFFNSEGTFISGFQALTTPQTITVPTNAVTMKATVDSADEVKQLTAQILVNIGQKAVKVEQELNSIIGVNPLDRISSDPDFVSSFETIVCMGDSLTAGNLNYNVGSTGEYVGTKTSYPSMLAKFTGSTVKTFGYGGIMAKDYYDYAAARGAFDDENKGSTYIISLGTNDIGYLNEFTGDPSTDINLSDYTQDAETSCGQYGKIIQKILLMQPKAKIFLSCIPNTRNTESTRTAANTKIKAIAALFPDNCYVMDFQTYGVKVDEVAAWKAKYYNGGHLNALGYNVFARMVLSYMNWIINNNPQAFRNIGFIGTDYDWNQS